MTLEEAKVIYATLDDKAPQWWGSQNSWYDRLWPWENFVDYGELVLKNTNPGHGQQFPALWELLDNAFPHAIRYLAE